MKQIITHLEQNDIPAERKSIYTDIELLRTYGMDIIQESGNYYVGSRYFELPELKLLVDSVQSSKFITYKKTGSLIKKIEEMASIYEAQLLNRQVYVTNRIKSIHCFPWSIPFRGIFPPCSTPGHPKHGIEHQTVILGRPSYLGPVYQGFRSFPLVVCQFISFDCHSLSPILILPQAHPLVIFCFSETL
jgi:hypothetical protein